MRATVTGCRSTGPCSVRWVLEAIDHDQVVHVVADSTPPRRGRLVVVDVAGFDGAPVTLRLRAEVENAVHRAALTWHHKPARLVP